MPIPEPVRDDPPPELGTEPAAPPDEVVELTSGGVPDTGPNAEPTVGTVDVGREDPIEDPPVPIVPAPMSDVDGPIRPIVGVVGVPSVGIIGVPIPGNSDVPSVGSSGLPMVGDHEVPIVGDVGVPIVGDSEVPIAGNVGVPIAGNVGVPMVAVVGVPIVGDVGVPMLGAPTVGSVAAPMPNEGESSLIPGTIVIGSGVKPLPPGNGDIICPKPERLGVSNTADCAWTPHGDAATTVVTSHSTILFIGHLLGVPVAFDLPAAPYDRQGGRCSVPPRI